MIPKLSYVAQMVQRWNINLIPNKNTRDSQTSTLGRDTSTFRRIVSFQRLIPVE